MTPPDPERSTVELLYYRAGGGHLSTARALKNGLESCNPGLMVRLTDIQSPDLLGRLDDLHQRFRISAVDVYNAMLRRDLTALDPLYLAISRWLIQRKHRHGVDILASHWQASRSAHVISLVPLLNRVIQESLSQSSRPQPLLTVMTDLGDSPPNYWFQDSRQIVLCPTEQAEQEALKAGYGPGQRHRIRGLILDPGFYAPRLGDRGNEQRRQGLDPGKTTALLLFGNNGSRAMLDLLRALSPLAGQLQLLMITGDNSGLRDRLQSDPSPIQRKVLGRTDRMPYWMQLADFMIGKPGNISISEAVHMNLPVIVKDDYGTLVQERYACRWIEEMGVGIVINRWRDLQTAVVKLLGHGRLAHYRNQTKCLSNSGLSDAVDVISSLISETGPTPNLS